MAGKAIYDTNCATCHGAAGTGDGPAGAALTPKPADLTAAHMNGHSNEQHFDAVTNGRPPMPAFRHLSEDDRWNVVDYLRTFSATLFP